MKKLLFLMIIALVAVGMAIMTGFTGSSTSGEYTANFEMGATDHQSIGELAFGPEGILFFGDSPGASIYALDTGDRTAAPSAEPMNVDNIQGKIAQKLGASAEDISIQDMAVNPLSGSAYLSISRGSGNSASWHLVKVAPDGGIGEMDLENARFSRFELTTAPDPEATDRRGRSLRSSSITDLSFADGQVYVAGISNEEFSSGFRRIGFPFNGEESLSTLEIYHVSHGQYETNAPIRTFVPYSMDGSNYIVAGYTCTPLVLFPMDNLGNGEHVRGKTVAELGNRNRPLDIIPYTDSNGNERLMIANSSYSVMRVNPEDFQNQEHLDQPMADGMETTGVPFEMLEYTDVMHMDNLNDDYLVMLQQTESGTDLRSIRK